jgi:hypothetical protein
MVTLRLVGEKKLSSHLIGSWLERFDSEYSPLIPDPSLKALSVGDNTRGTWIWDQSLMTVEINTIT